MVAGFNGAEIVFSQKPFVGGGGQPEDFLASKRLVAENLLSGEIEASRHGGEVEPGIDQGDVAAVGMVALPDFVIHQHTVGRSETRVGGRGRAQRTPANQHAHPHGVHTVRKIEGEFRHVGDDPTQAGKGDFGVDRFAILDHLRNAGQIERVVFGAPSSPGDGSQTLDSAAGEFTDAAGFDPLITEEWE